jgi:cellulose synthase/poly-beta-1,6-N-acetylglucosamine synthase-like glycosyltransferase
MPRSNLRISVLIPLRRINDYVRESLDHLSRQTYRNFDVYVITDEPETCEVPVGVDVKFRSSGPVPPNIKRMNAARESTADIVALLDDDAFPVPEWLEAAVAHFEDRTIVAVGGPGITPPHDSASQQASGAVYATPLVSAGYVYRYLPGPKRDVDDYPSCNLIVRREPFLKYVPECLRYWPGEDTKLCLLLTRGEHGRIVYDPAVAVYHHRRQLFWGHFKQVWNYAVHRGFFAKRYPDTSLRPQYFIPSLFVLGNVVAIGLLFGEGVRTAAIFAGILYAACVALAAAAARRTHSASPPLIALGIYLTHLTYGVGFMTGLLRSELDH